VGSESAALLVAKRLWKLLKKPFHAETVENVIHTLDGSTRLTGGDGFFFPSLIPLVLKQLPLYHTVVLLMMVQRAGQREGVTEPDMRQWWGSQFAKHPSVDVQDHLNYRFTVTEDDLGWVEDEAIVQEFWQQLSVTARGPFCDPVFHGGISESDRISAQAQAPAIYAGVENECLESQVDAMDNFIEIVQNIARVWYKRGYFGRVVQGGGGWHAELQAALRRHCQNNILAAEPARKRPKRKCAKY
jgi:hypothetical protein